MLVVLEVMLSGRDDGLVVELYADSVDAVSVDEWLLVDVGVI